MPFVSAATRVAFAVLLFFSINASAQYSAPWVARQSAAGRYIIERDGAGTSCRVATTEEALQLHAPDRSLLQRIDRGHGGRPRANASAITINLNATARLNANPTVKAAFVRAAEIWESIIADPITVSINVDYGPDFFGRDSFGDLTLGSTLADDYSADYPNVRSALIAKASSPTEAARLQSLPGNTLPTNLGAATRTGLSAIQLLNLGASVVPDPSIAFNSKFGFDFDPNNGIDADKVDFEAVAVHEMGHALGFGSNVGNTELTPGSELAPTILDLFRFRPGVTTGTFATAQRPMTAGGDQVFFTGSATTPLSTGRGDQSGGDGEQASHWKDDRFLGAGAVPIGLMDPRLPDGFRGQLSATDLAAFDFLGYTINGGAPTPTVPAAPSNLSATGIATDKIRLTWTDNSNNETEFRIEQKANGSFIDLGAASANATSAVVEGFSAGQSGTFRVRARNAAGNSGYTNEATGTTFGSGGPSTCTPSATVVCLLSDRFRVSIDYVNSFANPPQPGNFVGAKLVAGVQNPDVATFGISSPQAIEVVVRIQDARPFGINRFDIYYGGLTDLAYNVRVTDTQTGVSRTYTNAAGTVGGGVDRSTFSAALSGDDRLTSGGTDSFVIGAAQLATATSRMPLTKGESHTLLADVRAALAATANAGAGGACSELEPNQTAADATVLTLGQPCSGAANVADVTLGINVEGDLIEDLYKVTVGSGTLNVTMTYTNAGADLDLYLFRQVGGASYEILDFSAGFTQTEAVSLQVPAGTYYIGVSAFSGGSNYTVTASGNGGNPSVCTPSDTVACLLDSRFRVSIDYINAFANPPVPGSFRGAKLVAGSQNPDVATFGISSAQAIEVVVRVQDTRPFGLNRFDIYYGGLTDLEYTVTVTDTQKGTSKTYRNAPGTVGGGVDRSTFTAN